MNEEQARMAYWKAVELLNDIIKSGEESREDILRELENDLEE